MTTVLTTRLMQLMEETVAFSSEHVRDDGGIPFAAFVVDSKGGVLGRGVNCVREHFDSTAHAEIQAIRDACRKHATPYLRGAILLASGEPCALCYMSALNAGISQVFFAADRDEAAAHGFDYRSTYALFATDPLNWTFPEASKLAVPDGLQPFIAFSSVQREL